MAPLQRSKSTIQSDQLQIQHFIHQHLLHKVFTTSEFNCDGCNTGGDGVRFRCSACDFDLHEQCATSSHRISSNLHPQHHLILVNRPGGSLLCDVCKGFTNGLCYTCESQSCEFNVHTLCIKIPVVSTTAINHQQQQMPATVVGGYVGVVGSDQPLMVNHHQHMMQFGGVNTGQPVTVNHQPVMVNRFQQQPMQPLTQGVASTAFTGHHGVNTHQPMMVNHQQPIQQVASAAFSGNHNNQPMMVNHLQQQSRQGVVPLASTGFAANHGLNNNQSQLINHQQQQGFGGYQGGMHSQPVMVNHHQHQQQVALNTNQHMMSTNHHQQVHQQQGMGMPSAVGGYNVVNNNQTVMISHPPPPPQQQSNGFTNMGRLAANILSTSIIGIPLFNSRN